MTEPAADLLSHLPSTLRSRASQWRTAAQAARENPFLNQYERDWRATYYDKHAAELEREAADAETTTAPR